MFLESLEVIISLGLSFHTEKIGTRAPLQLVGRIKELGIKASIISTETSPYLVIPVMENNLKNNTCVYV